MRRGLPWLLLAVSAAFNVFFLVGYLRARTETSRRRTFRQRVLETAEKLDLNDGQLTKFEKLLDRHEPTDRRLQEHRDAFWRELIKDQPDKQVLIDYAVGESSKEHRLARLKLMQELVAVLRPEQRRKLVQLVRPPESRPSGP